MRSQTLWTLGISLLLATPHATPADDLSIVTTLPAYAAIAREIAGPDVSVESISRGDEDAHFVKPKPSFALMLRQADLFVTTGLDLELWAPVLIDKSGNRSIRIGAPGYVSASRDVPLLDVPEVVDRAGGDVHVYGNPHIFTSPLNAKIIATNIAAGLEQARPAESDAVEERLARFKDRIDRSLFGDELVDLLGGDRLDSLLRQGQLIPFLESNDYQGGRLIARLGGWLGKMLPMRGSEIVAYHKNWIYLTELLGLTVVDYVEPKPGIPPSARHVHQLIETIKSRQIRVLLAASYFSARQIASIAERTGARPVTVPLGPGDSGPGDYFSLVDLWIDGLHAAFTD